MNTDDPKNDSSQSQPNASDPTQDTGNDPSLVDLVDALQSVDPSSPEAPANATSIDDNNGGRIELNEDPPTFHDSERQAPLIKK